MNLTKKTAMNTTNTAPFILILAALYHESGRSSVAAGDTLAHTVGQAAPFTEFPDISHEAREGRYLTALNLEQRIKITGFTSRDPNDYGPLHEHEAIRERLARLIHDAEREAIELGKVVRKLNPPRPWIPFDQLPEVAQAGRRRQAAFFLNRFTIEIIAEG
ncbi:MAG: hypothetical protein JNL82_29885 [Myxococcales bacterium]|nr:hypothetical protein [Myxococcales bacterium]